MTTLRDRPRIARVARIAVPACAALAPLVLAGTALLGTALLGAAPQVRTAAPRQTTATAAPPAAPASAAIAVSAASAASADQWPTYGGDPGGTRYSPLTQIARENVSRLQVAWTYRTGELGEGAASGGDMTFEATPIHVDGHLYLSTAYGKIIALNPTTGAEVWTFDAKVDRRISYSEATSRGVSAWRDPDAPPDAACAIRIFFGTIDARLFSLDARTGRPCAGFGDRGQVDLAAPVGLRRPHPSDIDYEVTSPPAIFRDLVIIGSSIGDNDATDTGNGIVRAFDARTGAVRWHWQPVPRGKTGNGRPMGAANAWSMMSVDAARDLVFVPTTSPSPDFYGALRPGEGRDANSLVALRASTGARVWAFQMVHHDLWDYDTAAQPVLVTVDQDGRRVPAVAQATKMGAVFVLDRTTGRPLFPVEERPVPPSDVPGETASPTQPFPVKPRALVPTGPITADTVWGRTEDDRAACRAMVSQYASKGIFTPPSVRGTLIFPGDASGINWGSLAFDPERRLLVTNTTRLVTLVQLLPRDEWTRARAASRASRDDFEYGEQRGAPYGVRRRYLTGRHGSPCVPPPWGTLVAVDLTTGDVRWEVPFGDIPDAFRPHTAGSGGGDRIAAGADAGTAPAAGLPIGTPNRGGPLATASGLVFIGATLDNLFHAFDVETGKELWHATLPRAGVATPMTYTAADGRQMVVIAAGGYGKAGIPTGDFVIAFALPPSPAGASPAAASPAK